MARGMNGADIAWVLVATALVLLMTPALAFFYGGLVRSKNALNTMMMSVSALGFVGVAWAVLGYSLAFAPGSAGIGDLSHAFLRGVGLGAAPSATTIPHLLFMAFQGTFAIITAALISGAIVERKRFSAYLLFITLWSLLVYAPVAHWVWGGGFLAKLGALDFAGGTVVHINAGAAALVAAILLGPRKDFARQATLPHHVPFVLLGAGLLWFGWFGFNGGSALAANASAVLAFVNTLLAPMATLVVWTLLDLKRNGRVTAVGAATGIVVGLVAVTPAAGFVSPLSAARPRRRRRLPELLRDPLPGPDAPRRLARRRRRARSRRHGRRSPDGRPRREGVERDGGRAPLRQRPPVLRPAPRRRRHDRFQRRRRRFSSSSS